ncbi:hypothetical protein ATANTOWER_023733 [Ataeniobius toweri]|uniref:Uncharacterized protein n=1 Tax=Ataeniobius toweri TaxID=208326 RepID=A0ABU7BBM7_9TELE|nr:hypothetical protein [Ataeniobius toweri]
MTKRSHEQSQCMHVADSWPHTERPKNWTLKWSHDSILQRYSGTPAAKKARPVVALRLNDLQLFYEQILPPDLGMSV